MNGQQFEKVTTAAFAVFLVVGILAILALLFWTNAHQ